MKLIPLSQGSKIHKGKHFAQVDDEDYDWLNQWKWQIYKGYAVRTERVKKTKIKNHFSMHRVIMKTPKGMSGDHIDHDTLNNQKYNLRNCTHHQNMMNMKKQINTSSQYKGVCWNKRKEKYVVRLRANYQTINLGYFNNEEEAALQYNISAQKHFGEFANLNQIPTVY